MDPWNIAGIVLACTTGFLLFLLLITCCYCCHKLNCPESRDGTKKRKCCCHLFCRHCIRCICCEPRKEKHPPDTVVATVTPAPTQPAAQPTSDQNTEVIDIPSYHQQYLFNPTAAGPSCCNRGAYASGPAAFYSNRPASSYMPAAQPACGGANGYGIVRLNNAPSAQSQSAAVTRPMSYIASPPGNVYSSVPQIPQYVLQPAGGCAGGCK